MISNSMQTIWGAYTLLRNLDKQLPNPNKTNATPEVALFERSWLITALDETEGTLQEDESEMGPK